jgi:hypothetical protein
MRLVTEHALEIADVLRIECQLLTAVARVVVSRASRDTPTQFVVGVEFITVDFIPSKARCSPAKPSPTCLANRVPITAASATHPCGEDDKRDKAAPRMRQPVRKQQHRYRPCKL